MSNLNATTIEMWIPSIAGSTTSPPFDYLFAFGNTDKSEQGGNLPVSLGLATNLHLTCVFSCPVGVISIYTNGVLAGTFSGVTDPLITVGNRFAYIGRSLYNADAYLTWTIDELRIYNGALNSAEVAATDFLGPNQLLSTSSPEIGALAFGGQLNLTWPAVSAGFNLLISPNLAAANWTAAPITPQLINGQWKVTIPITNSGNKFFQLQK